jgi:hypothetical protein
MAKPFQQFSLVAHKSVRKSVYQPIISRVNFVQVASCMNFVKGENSSNLVAKIYQKLQDLNHFAKALAA